MTKRKIFIYLQDEAPRIGCGWRNIQIISHGPKWVRVRYAPLAPKVKGCRKKRNPIYVVNHRFPARVWASIESTARQES